MRIASVVLGVFVLASHASSAVIVVDPQGGSGNALLLQAIAAAADGDVLLLRAGTYQNAANQPYVVSGKGLTLANASGGDVKLGSILITQVPAGSELVLRGIDVVSPDEFTTVAFPEAVRVDQCVGTVWIEDATLTGANPVADIFSFFGPVADGSHAVGISASARVVLARCTCTGGKGGYMFQANRLGSGGDGIRSNSGDVTIIDTKATGGNLASPAADNSFSAKPGVGIRVLAGSAFVAGSSTFGGSNQLQQPFTPGGSGIVVTAGSLVIRDTTAVPGTDPNPSPLPPPIDAPAGAVKSLPATWRSVSISSPLAVGDPGTFTFEGLPGDPVLLLIGGVDGAPLPLLGYQGTLLAALPVYPAPIVLGVAPASGIITVPFTAPALPGGAAAWVFTIQAVVTSAGGTLEAATAYVQT